MIIYVHRLFTLLLDKYPQLRDVMDEKIKVFIEKPECRIKEVTTNIGDLLVFLTVSKKYKWDDLKEAYLNEQLDRQVFWVLQEVPQLDKIDGAGLEDAKIEASFKSTIIGYRITMLMKQLNTEIFEHYGKDFEKLHELLDSRYCRLTDDDETRFKGIIEDVFEVKGFLRYYNIVGTEVPDKNTLLARLKQAIKNSAEKKYHGDEKDLNVIPSIDLQTQELLHSKPTILKYWDEKAQVLDKADDDEFWKKLCIERFMWIRERVNHSFDEWKP